MNDMIHVLRIQIFKKLLIFLEYVYILKMYEDARSSISIIPFFVGILLMFFEEYNSMTYVLCLKMHTHIQLLVFLIFELINVA